MTVRLPSFLDGRGTVLDNGLAGFAALAFGFAALVMPEWRLTQLVLATPLPDLVSAAEPPLGLKARAGVAVGIACLSFALFWSLLRWSDRRPAETADEADPAPEPIRLRRSDAHPDAPPRRPLVAGRDLGEPIAEPLAIAPPEPKPEPEPEPEVEPVAAAEEPEELILVDEAPLELTLAAVEPEEAEAPLPEPEPAPLVAVERQDSISDLMHRLESGLSRRDGTASSVAEAPAPPAVEPGDPVGHRLRNAISDLQRLAART